mgnify:FL=1
MLISNKNIKENNNWIKDPRKIVVIKLNFFLIKLWKIAPIITPIPQKDKPKICSV